MEVQPLTLQEVFDRVWNWFVVHKNKLSWGTNSSGDVQCKYRGHNSTKCAIGIFIPKSEYNTELEHSSIHTVLIECPTVGKILGKVDVYLLTKIQKCHDQAAVGNGTVRKNLTEFAKDNSLTIPERIKK